MGMKRLSVLALLASFLILYIGCNGGSSGGGTTNTNLTSEQAADASGTWSITEIINDSACEETPHTSYDYHSVSVTQNGNIITVTDEDGNHYTGTVNGSTLSWTGSFQDNGGTVTITSMSLTISGTTLSGTANWTWSDGNDSCSGTTQISGTRTSPGGSSSTGFNGSWRITETGVSDSCEPLETDIFTTTITTNGSLISLYDPDGDFITGSVSGNTATFLITYNDGIESSSTLVTITLSADGKSLTGNVTWSETDEEGTCSGSSTITGTKL